MRTSAAFIIASLFCLPLMAQQGDNPFSLGFNIMVPEQTEPLPPTAVQLLKDKLGRLLTTNGMGSTDPYGRFIMAPVVTVLNKQAVRAGQMQSMYDISLTVYAGDRATKTRFASFNVELNGVDRNDERAMLAAIRSFSLEHKAAKAFIDEVRQKVADHFNTDCDKSISLARAKADGRQFEEALALLAAVPQDAPACYQRASQAMVSIHRQYIDHQCQTHLAKANAAFATEKFAEAAEALSQIYEDAACYNEARQLADNLRKRVQLKDDREFDLRFKKEFTLESQRIGAARAVGVAYGENQKPLIQADTKLEDSSWLWW